jgi:hypothetical protein
MYLRTDLDSIIEDASGRVPLGHSEWYLCDWRDEPDFEYREFHGGENAALMWLSQFRSDAFAMGALRKWWAAPPGPWLDDEALLRWASSGLAAGSIKARQRVVRREGGIGAVAAEAPAFSREPRKPPPAPSLSAPEEPLLPADVDAAALARAQQDAAALGIPFCEECVRQALAQIP